MSLAKPEITTLFAAKSIYEDIITEHFSGESPPSRQIEATSEAAALIDISPSSEFEFSESGFRANGRKTNELVVVAGGSESKSCGCYAWLFTQTSLIASDLDEVLGQFLKSFIAYYNRTHSTTYRFSDFNSYNFSNVLNRPYEEVQQVVYEYFHAPEFLHEYEPLPGATEGFEELREISDVHVVTARPAFTEAETRKFLTRHFAVPAESLHMGNHHPAQNCSRPIRKKSEICKSIGAKVLIDDCLEYAIDCAENANIPVVLFDWNGTYGWNKQQTELHPLITRVTSWSDVVDVVQDIVHDEFSS